MQSGDVVTVGHASLTLTSYVMFVVQSELSGPQIYLLVVPLLFSAHSY